MFTLGLAAIESFGKGEFMMLYVGTVMIDLQLLEMLVSVLH